MKFIIHYRNPETLEECTEEIERVDTEGMTADEWAEDYAYARADKGPYRIEALK